MRYLLVVFAVLHGICHLPGFAVNWRLMAMPELLFRTTILQGQVDLGETGIRVWGVIWLALAVAFAVLAVGVWSRASWWLLMAPVAVGFSALCCVLALPEARLGLAANLLLLALVCAAFRFPGGSPAVRHPGLERLWNSAPAGSGAVFDPNAVPEAGLAYLQHAVAPGTPLAAAVRLRMHGEIKLGRWHPFHAEQVIIPGRGMIWAANVSMFGLPVLGADQVLDGAGRMDWKILDTVPVMHAEGPDTSRSGAGRLMGEMAAWLPSALCNGGAEWLTADSEHSRFRLAWFGEKTELTVVFSPEGGVSAFWFPRWGNPDGGKARYIDFGVVVEQERTFGGYTLPSRVRAGWYYGTDRFAESDFFHATIDSAEFR